jgi:hypothetical protein
MGGQWVFPGWGARVRVQVRDRVTVGPTYVAPRLGERRPPSGRPPRARRTVSDAASAPGVV